MKLGAESTILFQFEEGKLALSRVLSLLRCSLRSPASGTATKRYLRLGNIFDRENTIFQTYARPGRTACRVFSCAHLSLRRSRELASARCFNEGTQTLEASHAIFGDQNGSGLAWNSPPCLLCRCCCCNRPVRAPVIFSASPQITGTSRTLPCRRGHTERLRSARKS